MAFDPLRAPTLAWGPLKPQRDKKERGFGKGGLEKLAQRRASHPPPVKFKCGDQKQITLVSRWCWFRPMIYEYCRLMKLPMLSDALLIGAMSFEINDAIGSAPS